MDQNSYFIEEIKEMNESSYLTLLGKLEHSDSWGFGDAFELLCFHTRILANAFDSGRDGFEKIDTALRDVLLLELIGVHEYHQSDWFVLSK